jgi:hypothetical protein
MEKIREEYNSKILVEYKNISGHYGVEKKP